MAVPNADIINRLQKEILSLQGFKPFRSSAVDDLGLGSIRFAFPNATFPIGSVHEFLYSGSEQLSATAGFITGLLSGLMKQAAASIWISSSRSIFPPGLATFGIEPDRIIFIDLQRQKDILWTIEEALKCEGLAAVVGEVNELTFTSSRRLQLAVEQSRVTGFIIRNHSRQPNITSSVARWRISHLPGIDHDTSLPGVGFPRWNVELMKVRNGKPGIWQLEWRGRRFKHQPSFAVIRSESQKKTG